jgi:hypothetical protein
MKPEEIEERFEENAKELSIQRGLLIEFDERLSAIEHPTDDYTYGFSNPKGRPWVDKGEINEG